MLVLTGEIREEIEKSYNYYSEMYSKMIDDPNDRNFYLGKLSGMDEVLSCLGYKAKMKYGLVTKEEE